VSSAEFLLEHFYYGQCVSGGKPAGDLRLLGASPGVTAEMVEQAVRRAALPPLIRSASGAWALVRGRSRQLPFLLVQAQQGEAGQVTSHYVVAPPGVLKSYGGNLEALMQVVEDDLPIFAEPAADPLPLLELAQAGPPTVSQQIDDLLELMDATGNQISVIEPLLAAIVQGVQLIIQGAPPDLGQRVAFVQGLLALLPPSARFGVTFTTHSLPSTEIDTQIRFYSDDVPPQETVIFNWTSQRVTGRELDDDYSRFVISQLRLDAELVIERNTAMTSIAGWRLNRGDKLVDALGYASQRIRLDEALRHNQPVNKDEVAHILEEDPTLTSELRALYARHLLQFSLAMEDMTHAAPVAVLLRANPELARVTYQQINQALDDGQAWLLYDTLTQWMSNPLGPDGAEWIELTHRAALTRLQELVDADDLDEINELLRSLQEAAPGVDIGRIIPEVVRRAVTVCARDAILAENLFLLALKHLNDDWLLNLLDNEDFRVQLSPFVNRAWGYIRGDQSSAAPSGMLAGTARSFGQLWEPVVLLRLAELACRTGRVELVDTPTLELLLRVAISPEAGQYAARILWVVNTVDHAMLETLEAPGPRYLLQMRLAMGDYAELGRQMIRQSTLLYPGDLQMDYLDMVAQLFMETPINTAEVRRALDAINQAGIRSVPLVVAAVAALKNQVGTADLDAVAEEVGQQLFEELYLLEVVPPATILDLLAYVCRRQNVTGAVWLARLVPLSAGYQGGHGIRMLTEMYRQMDWHEHTRRAALHMLRAYIRRAGDEAARRAIAYFGKELGQPVRRALEVSYFIKRFMGQVDVIDFAHRVRTMVSFLYDTASFYAGSSDLPKTGILLNVMDSLPGGLTAVERRALAENALTLGQAVVALGKGYRSGRPRDEDRYITELLRGQTDPRSAVDIWRVMGGYLTEGRRANTKLGAPAETPLAGRSSRALLDEVTMGADLLGQAADALPAGKAVQVSAEDVRDDVESMWSELEADWQYDTLRRLGTDLQRLADLVALIETSGDAKAVEESGLARRIDARKHRPRSALEFYRFIYGYYSARS
jgi:hypothetical protein